MKQLVASGLEDSTFRMTVEDVFTIEGRGTIATGRVETGAVRVRDVVHLKSLGPSRRITVLAVETFQGTLQEARAGDNVGILLGGVRREEVVRGDILAR
jgi:elongation factor Tu